MDSFVNAFVEYGLSIFLSGLELYACVTLWNTLFVSRNRFRYPAFLLLLGWVPGLLATYFYIPKFISQWISIGTIVLLLQVLYKGAFVLKLSAALLSYWSLAIVDAVVLSCAAALLGISLNDLIWEKTVYIIAITFSKLVTILLFWILQYLYRGRKRAAVKWSWLFLSLFFPIVSLLILTVFIELYYLNAEFSGFSLVLTFFLSLAFIADLFLFSLMEKESMAQQEQPLLKKQLEYQAEGILSLEQSYQKQRRLSHEFQRHVRALTVLANEEDLTALRAYLQHLDSDRPVHTLYVNTHHPLVDAILNQKYQTAQEKNIDVHFQVSDLSRVQLPANGLVVLLSNLLDNAIEACEKVRSPAIECKLLCEERLLISIRNSSLPVEIDGDQIITTKPDPIEHGFGLPMIRHILDCWHAEYVMRYSDGWFQFTIEAPLDP